MPFEATTAAAQQNARLLAATIQKLSQLQPTDRQAALRECGPIISQFGAALSGTRKDMISAWTSLDLALQKRMKAGDGRTISLELTGQARRKVLSQGRFVHGHRTGFDGAVTRLSPIIAASSLDEVRNE